MGRKSGQYVLLLWHWWSICVSLVPLLGSVRKFVIPSKNAEINFVFFPANKFIPFINKSSVSSLSLQEIPPLRTTAPNKNFSMMPPPILSSKNFWAEERCVRLKRACRLVRDVGCMPGSSSLSYFDLLLSIRKRWKDGRAPHSSVAQCSGVCMGFLRCR